MVPKGSSVIDYIIVNETCYNIINSFKVVSRVESDHMPIVSIRKQEEKRERTREKEEKKGSQSHRRRMNINIVGARRRQRHITKRLTIQTGKT